MRIVAGAGTGKTSTLTGRFVHLVEQHKIPPHEILAVTFSSKAANEMRGRIVERLNHNHRRLWIQTFHSLCLRLLGEWARAYGEPEPRVISEAARASRIRRAIETIPNAERGYYHREHGARMMEHDLATFVDRARDDLIRPGEVIARIAASGRAQPRLSDLARGFSTYIQILTDEGSYDFNELTTAVIDRLEADPLLLHQSRARFQHLLVDEFQDTNLAQFRLLELLTPAGNNICVVGDSNQAIYAFRGGRSEFFDAFSEMFEGAKTFTLRENYRSGRAILDAANRLVNHNHVNAQLQLIAATESDTSAVTVTRSATPDIEAESVARRILTLIGDPANSYTYNQFAVLFRSIRNSVEPFKRAFALYGIPFSLGPVLGLDYQIRQDILAALRLASGPARWNDAARIALGRGGSATARQLLEINLPLADHDDLLWGDPPSLPHLSRPEHDFLKNVRQVLSDVRAIDSSSLSMLCYEAIRLSGHLDEKIDPGQARQLASLINAATELTRSAGTVDDLMGLLHNAPRDLDDQPPDDPSGVQLLTVHAAKGLEWPVVFVAGMAETLFPVPVRIDTDLDVATIVRSLADPDDLVRPDEAANERRHLQEERRLAYVAVTRACRELHLSYASTYGENSVAPSRFLEELGLGDGSVMPYDDEREQQTTIYALGRQIRHRQAVALNTRPDSESASIALADLLVAQWAANHVPGVLAIRNRAIPSPHTADTVLRFSFSQLETYEKCPRQYLYGALLRLGGEDSGPALAVGNAVHNALEALNQLWRERAEPPSGDTSDAVIDRHWPAIGFDAESQSRQLRLRARAMVRRYYDFEREQLPARFPVWIEERIDAQYLRHSLTGKVDLVVQSPSGGVEIIDFKTGSGSKLSPQKSNQLYLYLHAWRDRADPGLATPDQVTYFLLKHSEDKGYRTGEVWEKAQRKSARVTPAWEDERQIVIGDLLDGVLANEFGPNPGDHCTFCRFRWICPEG